MTRKKLIPGFRSARSQPEGEMTFEKNKPRATRAGKRNQQN